MTLLRHVTQFQGQVYLKNQRLRPCTV